jgi:hypothetical protein
MTNTCNAYDAVMESRNAVWPCCKSCMSNGICYYICAVESVC